MWLCYAEGNSMWCIRQNYGGDNVYVVPIETCPRITYCRLCNLKKISYVFKPFL